MGALPSVPQDRSRKVQVICAGYSRTGTSTMALAIGKLLNGPFFHGGTQILKREDAYCRKWIEVYEAKEQGDRERLMRLLGEVTAGFVGVGDLPAVDFVPELMELYPQAKVVLVERDPDSWLQSVMVVDKAVRMKWLPYFLWVVPGWRWFPSFVRKFGQSANRITTSDPKGNTNPKLFFMKWNKMVKEMVPPEKLLVMDLKEGWDPLCKFLDLPVPNEPLPRVNDTNATIQMSKDATLRVTQIWATAIGTVVVLGFGAWRTWKTR
ncbi:P-loop containing nucleoside triphosphate hydrolase protein [Xylaria nigripes]|nr:P-loop containing nucleoside triphosphate hydrolase protein [Xylaria nigripes]